MPTAIINITRLDAAIEVATKIAHLKKFVQLQVEIQSKLIDQTFDNNEIVISKSNLNTSLASLHQSMQHADAHIDELILLTKNKT